MIRIQPDDRIWFVGERIGYTVQAVSSDGRWAACTNYCRYHRRAMGLGKVPAGPVVEHLHKLKALGWEHRKIAVAAGIPWRTVDAAVFLGRQTVWAKTARAILSVPLVEQAGRTSVDATEAIRRLHGLMRLGHSRRVISAATGYSLASLDKLVERGTCSAGMHLALRRACVTLSGPGASKHTRTIAERRGYVPLWAWDDIDDPAAQPQGVGRVVRKRAYADTAAEYNHLRSLRVSHDQARKQLGLTESALEQALYRARKQAA